MAKRGHGKRYAFAVLPNVEAEREPIIPRCGLGKYRSVFLHNLEVCAYLTHILQQIRPTNEASYASFSYGRMKQKSLPPNALAHFGPKYCTS